MKSFKTKRTLFKTWVTIDTILWIVLGILWILALGYSLISYRG